MDICCPLSTWMALFVRKCFHCQGLQSFLSGDSTGKRAKGQLTREIPAPVNWKCSPVHRLQRKINWLLGRRGQWKSNKLLKMCWVCLLRMGKTCLQIFLPVNFKSTCTKNCKHFQDSSNKCFFQTFRIRIIWCDAGKK